MGQWLQGLVTADLDSGLRDFKALQARIGAIHARIKVPNHLVMQGASLLKSRIGTLVAERDIAPDTAKAIIIILGELFDYAINLMSEAYVTDTRDRAKAEEAFRLYNLGQDINLERETQRAALMEWSQRMLFSLLGSQPSPNPPPLAASPFGLWLRHRASMLFPDSIQIDRMDALVQRIDEECLPAITGDSAAALGALQHRIEEVKFLLADLFQSAAAIENGRDPLTRTLNRRFLPSVLTREVTLANESALQLSVALFDVDHFKRVNDGHGHAVGDRVLGHIADTLLRFVRSSDFVFRYVSGGLPRNRHRRSGADRGGGARRAERPSRRDARPSPDRCDHIGRRRPIRRAPRL
jgi:diguanylate cyclase